MIGFIMVLFARSISTSSRNRPRPGARAPAYPGKATMITRTFSEKGQRATLHSLAVSSNFPFGGK
jgi:hypothetical protein